MVAGLALGGARGMRAVAADQRDAWPKTLTAPYAPTPAMVPYASLGFREAVADLLWIRMLGYLGGHNDTADGVTALVIATQAADPHFKRVYTDGVRAITSSHHDLTMAHKIRAAALAEEGMTYFPKDFDIADLAGTMYSVDLTTDDAAQKRAWREKGAMLLEKALRLPGATADDATYVAYLRSSLGQHERAVRELREMVLITNDEQSRREMIAKLAEMEQRDGNALQAALEDARREFEAAWQAQRPELPATIYVLVGPRPTPYIDFHALATDRDLVGTAPDDLEAIDYGDAPASPKP